MEHQTKTFAQAMDGALAEVASNVQSTKDSRILEAERKRHFLTVMLRWQAIFKRADSGSIENDKWLLAEYYKSLGHLTERGLDTLTEELKTRCTFFPSIKECLETINPPRYSYSNPFYGGSDGRKPALLFERPAQQQISRATALQIVHRSDDPE